MLPHELPKKVQVLAAEAFLKVGLPAPARVLRVWFGASAVYEPGLARGLSKPEF